jgi:thiamine-phosphate pyrophosphorylase
MDRFDILPSDLNKRQSDFSRSGKPIRGLYCLTSEEHSRGRSNIEVVKAIINAGVKTMNVCKYGNLQKELELHS